MKKLLLFSLFTLLASAMGWAATETWKKVTSTPDSWDGDYLIVYESGHLAFNGFLDELDAANNTTPVTISDGTITTNDCNFYFTIAKNGSNYTIQSKSGYYIGGKDTEGNELLFSKTDKYGNTISFEADKSIKIQSGKNVLRLNPNSNKPWFRYYKISTYTNQKPIALYKKQEGQAPQPTQVAPLEIKPGFGTIEVGTEIKISCATGGAVLNGTIGTATGTETLEGAALPYTFIASEVGEIEVGVWATNTKDGYKDSEPLSGTFIVKAAVPVAYRDVITPADLTNVTSYPSEPEKLTKGGASYLITAIVYKNYIQLNNKSNAGIVMNVSNAAPSKIIIKWNGSHSNTLNIYGKNIPYTATSELYGSDKGNLIGTATYDAESTVVELDGTYTYIGLVSNKGAMTIRSIEFIWNEGAAGGADVTYTKASEAKAGNFAVLATATAKGKAVGRNADLSPVNVTVSGDAIGLNKSQPDIDEFEIVEKDAANKIYQLCGGLSKSRRFLTYDAAGGVTTTAATVTKVNGKDVVSTTDDNADVTFVSTEAGLLVKFKDGKYLMFNGTNFVKGEYTEVATQADGVTLTPVIVFMSSSNVSTGVETVEFDENAEAQYFNLNGVQVKAENLTPGLYIVRQGNKVSKQVIR